MKKVYKKYVHPSNFVSNIEKRDKDFLLKVAKKRNIKIYVDDKAYDGNGTPLKGICSVFSSNTSQDMNDLWIEYNYMLDLVKKGQYKYVMKELECA
jgi:hypothetical protein